MSGVDIEQLMEQLRPFVALLAQEIAPLIQEGLEQPSEVAELPVLNIPKAAAQLNNIDHETLKAMCRSGEIEAYLWGRQWRISHGALVRWVQKKQREAAAGRGQPLPFPSQQEVS